VVEIVSKGNGRGHAAGRVHAGTRIANKHGRGDENEYRNGYRYEKWSDYGSEYLRLSRIQHRAKGDK